MSLDQNVAPSGDASEIRAARGAAGLISPVPSFASVRTEGEVARLARVALSPQQALGPQQYETFDRPDPEQPDPMQRNQVQRDPVQRDHGDAKGDTAPIGLGVASSVARRPGRTERLSVMLVDDDEVDAKYVSWLLGCIDSYQFEIVHVTSSEAALAEDARRHFDLYLVDFWLMHETSVSLIGRLGRAFTRPPVVVLTNLANGDIEDLGLRAGALGFLSKGDLSEKALELVISSSLFIRRLEADLQAAGERLLAERQQVLAQSSSSLLTALSHVDKLERIFRGLDAGSQEGAGRSGSNGADLLASISEARRGILDSIGSPCPAAKTAPALPDPQCRADLRSCIDAAVADFRSEARARGASISMALPRASVALGADPLLLRALVVALLDRVTDEAGGGVSLRVWDGGETVSLGVAAMGDANPALLQQICDSLQFMASGVGARVIVGDADAGPGGGREDASEAGPGSESVTGLVLTLAKAQPPLH